MWVWVLLPEGISGHCCTSISLWRDFHPHPFYIYIAEHVTITKMLQFPYMWNVVLGNLSAISLLLQLCYFIFIRPFEKRDVLCRGNVRPSVRLSVRPSVRPRFPNCSSTCFEISIWNLVYTFSRWHDMSSLSCITIGSLWPSLQPKVGQTYFLQSWPHK